jgi:arabinan endo-1,5-alpha-L-arabinosidase
MRTVLLRLLIGAATALPLAVPLGAQPAVPPYRNPVLSAPTPGVPDPTVLKVGDRYYLYATTGGRSEAFSQYSSQDLVKWQSEGYMFTSQNKPEWIQGDCWAPDVQKAEGGFLAYYTARDRTGRLCLGLASSPSPTGPWSDLGRPFLRDPRVGMIDPNAFLDGDGTRYLYWKGDHNDLRPKEPTPIYVQRLSPDGRRLVGERREVLRNTLAWEGDLVEGTCAVRHGDYVYLFYAANAYYDGRYATGVARSRSALGPFEKKGAPVLRSGGEFEGPGHGTVAQGPDGHDYYLYHAWHAGKTGDPNSRNLLLDRIRWGQDGWPSIGDGTPSGGSLPQDTEPAKSLPR